MKKIFTLLCVALCATSLFANVVTGTCGDNLQWAYDTDTHALTITGSGDMYWSGERPWEQVASAITSVSLLDGITNIGYSAFSGCSSLASITIPNSVTSIGNNAFYGCDALTSITIPNSVTSIGGSAFSWCYSLTSITIGNSVTSIGGGAFAWSTHLTTVNYTGDVASWCDIYFEDNGANPMSEADRFYINDQEIKNLIIPNSVKRINDYAFSGCNFTSVTIPNSVTSIGDFAFNYCSQVTMQGTTPPSISANTFSDNATIFVPCSSIDAYLAAPVWQFLDLHGLSHHVNLNATEGGSAEITATDCESSSVTVEAYASENYQFKQWSDGNTDNPRTLTLTRDIALTAEFEEIPYYSVTISGNYIDGYVSIWDWHFNTESSAVQFEVQGGTEVYFREESNCGLFLGWSDGVTERERTVVITSDTTISSIFEASKYYTVNISGDNLCGSYEVEGGMFCNTHWTEFYNNSSLQLTMREGTSITFSDAYIGECGNWTGWSDGVTERERTIVITSDTTIYSIIEYPELYTVNISGDRLCGYYGGWGECGGSYWDEYYGTSSVQLSVLEGTSVSVREDGDCGSWLGWSDGSYDRERTIYVTSDTTISSRFDVQTYSVSITAGEGGYLEYGNIEREYNECNREWIYNCAYANDGYYFAGWSDGNTSQCIDIYPDTDINLVAQFAPKSQVQVLLGVDNASKGMGSVSGSGIFYSGDWVTITATPNAGYHFLEWSDGNGDATRKLYLQSDTTLFATFAPGEYGGKCGENLYWTYSDNTITITGSGDMDLYAYSAWHNYYEDWYHNVTAVQFPEGITSIDDYAFSSMSLTNVVVPASVTYFGENTFAYNDNLTRFEYLGSEAECNGHIDYAVLKNSYNLKYFKGQKDMLGYIDSYSELDTVIITSGEGFYEFYWSNISYLDLFNSDDWVIKGDRYDSGIIKTFRTLILPEYLEEIGDYAFYNARYLGGITIPAGVTRIGDGAFEDCRSMDSVVFASNALREIGDWAFYNCHSLKKINIPEGVTEIGKAAFFDCAYLKEITLPTTTQTVADNAFGQCQKVAKMTVNAVVPPVVEAETFEDIDRNIPLYVPMGTALQYKEADYWCEFFNVIEYNAPSSVENAHSPSSMANSQKLLRNGQLIIIRDGVEYNTLGAKIQ